MVGSIAQGDAGECSPAHLGCTASPFERRLTALRYGHDALVQHYLCIGVADAGVPAPALRADGG